MGSKAEGYHVLQDSNNYLHNRVQEHHPHIPFYRRNISLSKFLIALSLAVNFVLAFKIYTPLLDVPSHDQSLYAGLVTDTVLTYKEETEYTSDNMTLSDQRWAALSADNGVVALSKDWASAKGLPESGSQFPWDSSKSIYLLSAYHGIHCVAQIHLALREYRDGKPQSHTFEHSTHCLDWLRNDIICHADDTPMYTTSSMVSENGIGQAHQCKDWSKLEHWAKEHHACYQYGDFVVEDKNPSQIGRFKYCPKNSPYLPAVRKYYGESDN